MLKSATNFLRRCAKDFKSNRVAQGVGLMAVSAAAAAQDSGGSSSIDTTTMLAAIAGGLGAAILVSVTMTSAHISVKASKLPRKAA